MLPSSTGERRFCQILLQLLSKQKLSLSSVFLKKKKKKKKGRKIKRKKLITRKHTKLLCYYSSPDKRVD